MMEGNHTINSNHGNEDMHVGSFTGHVVPGSVFLWVSLNYTIQLYHCYFSARKSGRQFKASHAHPYWFCHRKKIKWQQIEAIFRLMLISSGIIGEIITGYDKNLKRFTNQMMHAEHISMFTGFAFATIVDIMKYHNVACLPDGSDYFCGFGALAVEFVLFAYHLHGRTLLNTHLHTLLIYTIGLNAVATITEYIYRDKFIWSLPRIVFLWLQGTWFYQIAFVLFNPYRDSPTLDVNDNESVMVVTLYFAGHILLAFAVQFLIGGLVYLCNGRPALKLNRDYTQLEEISTSGSSQSSASNSVTEKQGSGSDNELWEETSKLIEELPHS